MRHVLVVTPRQNRLYRVLRSKTQLIEIAERDVDLKSWLVQHLPRKGGRLAVWTDLAEESYGVADLPVLWRSRDQHVLLERRLAQQNPDSTWRSYWLHVDSTKPWRPPVRASFCALRAAELYRSLLEVVVLLDLRLEGVWPACLAAPALLSAQERKQKEWILFSTLCSAGLRHTLIRKGRVWFSRLSSLNLLDEPQTWEADALRTAQYLKNQPWLEEGHNWRHAWLLASEAAELSALSVERGDSPILRHQDWYAAVALHAMPSAGAFPVGDATVSWRAWRYQRMLLGGMMLSAAIGAAWIGQRIWMIHHHEIEAQNAQDEAMRATEQTRAILATARGDLSTADLAETSVQFWQTWVQQQPSPAEYLTELAGIFESYPDVQIQNLNWALARPDEDQKSVGDPTSGTLNDERCMVLAASQNEQVPESSVTLSNSLMLDLTLQLPQWLSPRKAVQTQERLVSDLEAMKWLVWVLEPAVQIQGDGTHTGTVGRYGGATVRLCIRIIPPKKSR